MSNVPIAPFVRRHSRYPSERRRGGGGFTLLELLIVIGIIALLISLLLPALARTRESARQVTCMGHLRELAAAMMAYVNDNDGAFPAAAGSLNGNSIPPAVNDWVDWQPSGNPSVQNIATGGLGPFLHLNYGDQSSWSVLRCPSDDAGSRPLGGSSPYPFSYVLNGFLATPPMQPGTGGSPPTPGAVRSLRQVKDPSQKILFYEEDVQTLNDGCGNLYPPPQNANTDLLAVRHDWSVHGKADGSSDTPSGGTGTYSGSGPNVSYPDAKGNVVYCDGHGDFITRREAHSKAHYGPDLTVAPFNDPNLP